MLSHPEEYSYRIKPLCYNKFINTNLSFKNRNIAITDLETTGLDPLKHEIVEIGLVLVTQPELEIIDTFDIKIKPENLTLADPKALEINGYNHNEWLQASSLKEAMGIYLSKVKGTIFCAHNITFDLPFIKQACIKTNLDFTPDYHCIDIPSLAWSKFRNSELEGLNLSKLAEFMGLKPEPETHRAISGAMLAYDVLRELSTLEP